jgi:hypothetical protein
MHGESMQRQLSFERLRDRRIVFDYEDIHYCDPMARITPM